MEETDFEESSSRNEEDGAHCLGAYPSQNDSAKSDGGYFT